MNIKENVSSAIVQFKLYSCTAYLEETIYITLGDLPTSNLLKRIQSMLHFMANYGQNKGGFTSC